MTKRKAPAPPAPVSCDDATTQPPPNAGQDASANASRTQGTAPSRDLPPGDVGLRVLFTKIDALTPYARNSRTHSTDQVRQLAGAISEWGFTSPVLADATGIVAGHGRVLAASLLYSQGKTINLPNGTAIPTGTVPVVDVSGWSDAKRRAYVIADNKLALNAGWDENALAIELDDLSAMGFTIDLLGFDGDELARLSTAFERTLSSTTVHDDRFLVLVDCGNEQAQQSVFEELKKRGLECKLMS